MNAAVAPVMESAQPQEVRVGLSPSTDLISVGQVGVVHLKSREVDLVDDRELEEMVMELEAVAAVGLLADRVALRVLALVEADPLPGVAHRLGDVRRAI